MKYIKISCLAIVILGAALLAASCSKAILGNSNNPVAVSLPSADFGITILDYERGYDRDSNYVFEGVWEKDAFLFGVYKTEKMVPNITPDNGITFRINSDSPNFQGVNASSSKACIDIVQDGNDHTVYHLEWVEEGETTITFWNGEGESKKEISFTATSKKEIPLEGFKYRTAMKEYIFTKFYADHYIQARESIVQQLNHHEWKYSNDISDYTNFPSWRSAGCNYYYDDWEKMVPIEIYPVPLNATPTAKPMIMGVGYTCTCPEGPLSEDKIDALNTANYPQFRWFKPKQRKTYPFEPNEDSDEAYKKAWEEKMQDQMRVYPSDLRERRIKLFYSENKGRPGFSMEIYCGNEYDFEQKDMTYYHFRWEN